MSSSFMSPIDRDLNNHAVPLKPYERYTPKNEEANNVRTSVASLRATNF